MPIIELFLISNHVIIKCELKVMKRLAIYILLAFLSTSISANEDKFGIGIIAGKPTGISVKKWVSTTTAFAGAVSWVASDNNEFYLHADYLVHDYDTIRSKDIKGKLAMHYGVGGFIELKKDNHVKANANRDDVLGVRVPVGLSYLLPI